MGEPLTGLESWLWARGPSWQVVTVCLLKGQVTRDNVIAQLADRISYAPRWRKLVKSGLLGSQWVDDPSFDIGNHVRDVPVADLSGITGTVCELLESPLRPDAPPWEAVVMTGGPRRTALIVRAAPALIDGYDHIHLLQESLDNTAVLFPDELPHWEPEPEPRPDVVADAWTSVLRGVRQPRKMFARAQAGAGLMADGVVRAVTPTVTSRQLVGSTEVPIDKLRHVRMRHRVTTHDVLVTLVAGGYASWLAATGQPVVDKIAQIPLATREQDVLGSAIGSRVAPQWVGLPLSLSSAVDRLQLIASLTRSRIDSGRLVSAHDLSSLAGFVPPTLTAVGASTVAAGRPWDILVTNIPGPATGRFFGTAAVTSCHQVIGSPAPGAATVTITTYQRMAALDVVVPTVPDAFVSGIMHTLEELSTGPSADPA